MFDTKSLAKQLTAALERVAALEDAVIALASLPIIVRAREDLETEAVRARLHADQVAERKRADDELRARDVADLTRDPIVRIRIADSAQSSFGGPLRSVALGRVGKQREITLAREPTWGSLWLDSRASAWADRVRLDEEARDAIEHRQLVIDSIPLDEQLVILRRARG